MALGRIRMRAMRPSDPTIVQSSAVAAKAAVGVR
jgi:hypothetical protein